MAQQCYYDPVRRILADEGTHHYAPFGNTKARNLLEGYVPHNEAAKTKMLLLGCADLRHILHTAAESYGDQTIDFHISSSSKSATARNMLILHIIASPKFRPDSKQDLSFLWDVWYNFEWGLCTKSRFSDFLLDLESNDNWKQHFPSAADTEAVRDIWQFWKSNMAASSKITIENGLKIRNQRLKRSAGPVISVSDTSAAQVTTSLLGADDTLQSGVKPLKEAFFTAARKFFSSGTLTDGEKATTCCLNPTLLQPLCLSWDVEPQTTPLHSFYPISNKDFAENPNVMQFCLSVLRRRIFAFRKALEEGRIKLFFYVEDPIKLCLDRRGAPYDVVDTAGLADQLGLANLLIFAADLLRNQHSLLYTEAMGMTVMNSTTYLNAVLGVSLELIPALFGLRLLNNLLLGSDTPCSLDGRLYYTFRWGVPAFDNNPRPTLDLEENEDFRNCISNLRESCFNGQDRQGNFLTSYYTPLTLGLILRSMTARFSFNLAETLGKIKVPRPLKMSWTLICHWLCGGKVLEYSHERMNPCRGLDYDGRFSTLDYRPRIAYKDSSSSTTPSFIETLRLEAVLTSETIQHFRVSFLVPDTLNRMQFERGSLEIYDVFNGQHMAQSTEVKQLTLREYTGTLPYLHPHSERAISHDYFRILSFTELGKQYRLVLNMKKRANVDRKENAAGYLQVSTDRVFPCVSAHKACISVAGSDIPPLEITFACPVFAEDIEPIFCPQRNSFVIWFKKEMEKPWPEDFEKATKNRFKLDVTRLSPLPQQRGSKVILKHLERQHLDITGALSAQPYMETMMKRRSLAELVTEMFKAVISGKELLFIRTDEAHHDPGFFIRVHAPLIRYSRRGTPLMCVTACDHWLAGLLMMNRALCSRKLAADLPRIHSPAIGQMAMLVDPNTLTALRVLLTHNALLVEPTVQQKNQFPLGPNEPWIASYITPIYADSCAVNPASALPFMMFMHTVFSARERLGRENPTSATRCANCNGRPTAGTRLLRCSRCRISYYCNQQCQASHWPVHRSQCRGRN